VTEALPKTYEHRPASEARWQAAWGSRRRLPPRSNAPGDRSACDPPPNVTGKVPAHGPRLSRAALIDTDRALSSVCRGRTCFACPALTTPLAVQSHPGRSRSRRKAAARHDLRPAMPSWSAPGLEGSSGAPIDGSAAAGGLLEGLESVSAFTSDPGLNKAVVGGPSCACTSKGPDLYGAN